MCASLEDTQRFGFHFWFSPFNYYFFIRIQLAINDNMNTMEKIIIKKWRLYVQTLRCACYLASDKDETLTGDGCLKAILDRVCPTFRLPRSPWLHYLRSKDVSHQSVCKWLKAAETFLNFNNSKQMVPTNTTQNIRSQTLVTYIWYLTTNDHVELPK